MRHPSTKETSCQHEFRMTAKSDRFLREFEVYCAVYEKLEVKRKLDLTVRLLDTGREIGSGTRTWIRRDLEDIARWKGLRPPMLTIERNALDIEGPLERALRIEDEATRIDALCNIRGMGPVLASVMLMFTWPQTCGFMDYHTCNALRYLSFDLPKKYCTSRFTVPQLLTYLGIIRTLGEGKNTSAMQIAKALYALDNVRTRNKWREQFDVANCRLPPKDEIKRSFLR